MTLFNYIEEKSLIRGNLYKLYYYNDDVSRFDEGIFKFIEFLYGDKYAAAFSSPHEDNRHLILTYTCIIKEDNQDLLKLELL